MKIIFRLVELHVVRMGNPEIVFSLYLVQLYHTGNPYDQFVSLQWR